MYWLVLLLIKDSNIAAETQYVDDLNFNFICDFKLVQLHRVVGLIEFRRPLRVCVVGVLILESSLLI